MAPHRPEPYLDGLGQEHGPVFRAHLDPQTVEVGLGLPQGLVEEGAGAVFERGHELMARTVNDHEVLDEQFFFNLRRPWSPGGGFSR